MKILLSALAGIPIGYLTTAFLKWELDASNWGEPARFGCLCMCLIAMAIAGWIGYAIEETLKKGRW